MKLNKKRSLIGIAVLEYNEAGVPTIATFKPIDYVLNTDEVQTLLPSPAKTVEDITKHAESVVAKWFLAQECFETADRETSKVETQIISSEKWPSGVPKYCELGFYFVETLTTRQFTGVR